MHIDKNCSTIMHGCMVGSSEQIDWKLIQAFVAVMEEGTLSGAAKRLKATQPTLGRQIRELETRSGDVLFARRGLRLEPTAHATNLLSQAREIERGIADLGRKFKHAGDGAQREKISITAPTLLADELLPHVLPDLRAVLPATSLEVIPSDTLEDIFRRRVDFALRLVQPSQPDLIARKLLGLEVGLYASKDYLSGRGIPDKPTDLMSHNLILPANDRDLAIGMDRLGLSVKGTQVIALCDDLRNRLAMIRAGLGVSTCHSWIGDRDPSLIRVLPELVLASFDVWLVATDDMLRSKSLRSAWDVMVEAVPKRVKQDTTDKP
jgi:DNA-binding transcriptional LysR family regulator